MTRDLHPAAAPQPDPQPDTHDWLEQMLRENLPPQPPTPGDADRFVRAVMQGLPERPQHAGRVPAGVGAPVAHPPLPTTGPGGLKPIDVRQRVQGLRDAERLRGRWAVGGLALGSGLALAVAGAQGTASSPWFSAAVTPGQSALLSWTLGCLLLAVVLAWQASWGDGA